MNKTFVAAGVGALFLFGVVAGRADFFRTAADAAPRPGNTPERPFVVAQADNQPQPAAPQVPAPATVPAPSPIQPVQAQSPQEVYMQDQASVDRINAQIDAVMATPKGGFAVTYYAKPAPLPEPREGRGKLPEDQQSSPQPFPPQQQARPGEPTRDRNGNPEKYVIARAGDTVYATLDRAFNSDDPQAPIFATIRDVDNSGIQGPLDGVRMVGKLKYSSSQSSIEFEKGYLPDGRPVEVKGIAISQDTARTGFAQDVDNHEIERYGGLLLATLVQGAGQVGQTLVQGNQQGYYDPNTGFFVSQQKVSPYQAALGALLPAGQALTAVAAQGFNKPATISAPAGFGLGIVFLEPVVLPRDVLFARAR